MCKKRYTQPLLWLSYITCCNPNPNPIIIRYETKCAVQLINKQILSLCFGSVITCCIPEAPFENRAEQSLWPFPGLRRAHNNVYHFIIRGNMPKHSTVPVERKKTTWLCHCVSPRGNVLKHSIAPAEWKRIRRLCVIIHSQLIDTYVCVFTATLQIESTRHTVWECKMKVVVQLVSNLWTAKSFASLPKS